MVVPALALLRTCAGSMRGLDVVEVVRSTTRGEQEEMRALTGEVRKWADWLLSELPDVGTAVELWVDDTPPHSGD